MFADDGENESLLGLALSGRVEGVEARMLTRLVGRKSQRLLAKRDRNSTSLALLAFPNNLVRLCHLSSLRSLNSPCPDYIVQRLLPITQKQRSYELFIARAQKGLLVLRKP